jgi:succinate-semialdehyde dehydrogenase/glutarate-semialdehyde dehydrogenase
VVHYRPRGVVLVISPWNYPFTIPFGEVVMALLAGNAVILKPASLTPLIALAGRDLMLKAGLDPDLFQVLPCPGRVASEMIEMGVDYVNFTGSTGVGKIVSQLCGKHLIPCTMELGGKDPALVLPDADTDLVAGSLVWGAFTNAGQTCASIERAYVHERIYDEVVRKVVARVNALVVGNPLEDGTDMGPMTDPEQLGVVERQVQDAVARGARALTGGSRLQGEGLFYPPTVLVDVTDDMEAAREETFGPTLPIMRFSSIADGIRRANDSIFGLDAYVYGRDRDQTARVAQQMEAGTVMINETLFTHAAPETPWGGVKQSGVGRVHGDEGLRHLCEAYHINEETVSAPAWSPFWQPYSHRMYRALLGMARLLSHSKASQKVSGAAAFVSNAYQIVRSGKKS